MFHRFSLSPVHPLMFHRVFLSYTTHSFHRDSFSPDHFLIISVYPLSFHRFSFPTYFFSLSPDHPLMFHRFSLSPVHPLMFHRVFPSYTTHSFHRDSLSPPM